MEDFFTLDSNMPVIQALAFLQIASRTATGQRRGMSVTEVAEALSIDVSRASRNIGMLRDAGLIDSVRDPLDPRTKLNSATREGMAFLSKITSRLP